MKAGQYNPEIHHRKSIRLKGHDYAGGGLYFVTICAHRDFVMAAKGMPFGMIGNPGATKMSPVHPMREIIREEIQHTADLLPWMQWKEYAIMPDHFHALIEIKGGYGKLGDVVGGFKAGVSRNIHRRGGILPVLSQAAPIWHRNYYEVIVRNEEEERRISQYIRMNPWKLIISGSYEGKRFRAIGNPNLLNLPKVAVLCSRRVPAGTDLEPPERDAVFMSGFHSPTEKEILARLLKRGAKIICCPSWGIDKMRIPLEWLPALEENRMMIMEMMNCEGTLAASEERNRFVLDVSEERWIPYVTPGGMLARMLNGRS